MVVIPKSTNSFAFFGPIPYTVLNIYSGFAFSASIFAITPVSINSINLDIIDLPILGWSCNWSIDVILLGKDMIVSWAFL